MERKGVINLLARCGVEVNCCSDLQINTASDVRAVCQRGHHLAIPTRLSLACSSRYRAVPTSGQPTGSDNLFIIRPENHKGYPVVRRGDVFLPCQSLYGANEPCTKVAVIRTVEYCRGSTWQSIGIEQGSQSQGKWYHCVVTLYIFIRSSFLQLFTAALYTSACAATMVAYIPPCPTSSACVPTSTSLP